MLTTIDSYPADTLEGLIAREWASMILECEDPAINLEPIRAMIEKSRAMMRNAGWPPTYQHKFLLLLRNDITALPFGHPVARQFCEVLTTQLEAN
jgi:hypothetical protein